MVGGGGGGGGGGTKIGALSVRAAAAASIAPADNLRFCGKSESDRERELTARAGPELFAVEAPVAAAAALPLPLLPIPVSVFQVVASG